MGSIESHNMYENFYEEEIEDLTGVEFIECTFDGVIFEDIQVKRSRFENCKFKGCKFNGSVFHDSALINCSFRFSRFFSTDFKSCKLTGSSFIDTDISLIEIDGGDWSYTNLSQQNFSNKKFRNVDFSGSDFSFTNFQKSTVTDCSFVQSRIFETNFIGADIRSSRFDGNIAQIKMKKTKIDLEQAVLIANGHGGSYTP